MQLTQGQAFLSTEQADVQLEKFKGTYFVMIFDNGLPPAMQQLLCSKQHNSTRTVVVVVGIFLLRLLHVYSTNIETYLFVFRDGKMLPSDGPMRLP